MLLMAMATYHECGIKKCIINYINKSIQYIQ